MSSKNKNKKLTSGQAGSDPVPGQEENHLSRAALLLEEARSGFLSVIGGSGPYEDKANGIFFQRIEGKESKVFLLSQWNTLVDKLLSEIKGEEDDA